MSSPALGEGSSDTLRELMSRAPEGKHVLWVQVPDLDSLDLYDRAVAEGIHIAPGPLFSASGGFRDHLRLNTGFPWTDQIEAQVLALGRLVELSR